MVSLSKDRMREGVSPGICRESSWGRKSGWEGPEERHAYNNDNQSPGGWSGVTGGRRWAQGDDGQVWGPDHMGFSGHCEDCGFYSGWNGNRMEVWWVMLHIWFKRITSVGELRMTRGVRVESGELRGSCNNQDWSYRWGVVVALGVGRG